MSTTAKIEQAVENLSPAELQKFRQWFESRFAPEWDKQFESDVSEGKLNWLADEARKEKNAGTLNDR